VRNTSRILSVTWAAVLLAACSGNGASIPTTTTPAAPPAGLRVPFSSPFVMYDSRGHVAHLMLTREGMRNLRIHPSASGPLAYRGGPVQTTPKVVLILWGMTSTDAEAVRLTNFFNAVGGSPWQNVSHQYTQNDGGGFCTSSEVNTSICAGNQTGELLATVVDTSSVPKRPGQNSVASIAAKWAGTYGHGPQINYFVAIEKGHDPSGFRSSWCAFHSYTGNGSLEVSYTDFPYQTDAGANCGEDFINGGSSGTLDGVTVVGGHEYAETVTDPEPNSGWLDSSGGELGDKCAWLKPPAANVSMGGTTLGVNYFPVQGLWSDAATGCAVSY
jgi:hypothetical protein